MKNFGKLFLNKLKEEIGKKGNRWTTDSLYSIYVSVGGEIISPEKTKQNKVLSSYFCYHRIPVKKRNDNWTFDDNVLERIEEKINSFKKKNIISKNRKTEKHITQETIEVILQSNNLTKEALDKFLGGKIIQEKRGLYRIQVPKENKRKIFSIWLNSELNNLGTVMIDLRLEKEFNEIAEKI